MFQVLRRTLAAKEMADTVPTPIKQVSADPYMIVLAFVYEGRTTPMSYWPYSLREC